jgi:hypothetical protein
MSEQATEAAGREPTPALYIAALRRVFAEAHRVLADEGTVWIATGDLHANLGHLAGKPAGRHARAMSSSLDQAMTGLPAASLLGLPWQLAFALRDDGWTIRNAIVWHQPDTSDPYNPPEDRLRTSYDLIFLLVKQDRYHFDAEALGWRFDRSRVAGHGCGTGGSWHTADPSAAVARRRHARIGRHGSGNPMRAIGNCGSRRHMANPTGERQATAAKSSGNVPDDVWIAPAPPAPDALPAEVPLACIAAGCRPGGTVLDMFAGTAITGLAARELGRSFIGIEASRALCDLGRVRLSDGGDRE